MHIPCFGTNSTISIVAFVLDLELTTRRIVLSDVSVNPTICGVGCIVCAAVQRERADFDRLVLHRGYPFFRGFRPTTHQTFIVVYLHFDVGRVSGYETPKLVLLIA